MRSRSTETGECDYCSAREVSLLNVTELAPRFEAMMGLYHELTADTMLPLEDPLKVGSPLLTQQLCDAVRSAGSDGILYPSTRIRSGANLVVFDPTLCRVGRSWVVH